MKAVLAGVVGQRVCDERLAVTHRIVQAAKNANAEFILVAWDTFEDKDVNCALFQKVTDILAVFAGLPCC